jgi:hypothetical protein
MIRRMLVAVAALLSAFALSTGPASASPNDIHAFEQESFIDQVQVITEPAGCTATAGPVRSAQNHFSLSSGITVRFYADVDACNLNVPLPAGVLEPLAASPDLDGDPNSDTPATYYTLG